MTTRNVIRKDGWLYCLAYGMRHEKRQPTGIVNLCDTIWLAIGWGLMFAVLGAFAICIVCVALACVVGTGALVWWGLIPILIGWLDNPHLPTLSAGFINLLKFLGYMAGFFAVLIALIRGLPAFAKSEAAHLLGAYIHAKKEKFCPIYEVV